MISRDIIEAIRERTNIVDVVSQTVTLKRKGNSYMGLCPFHQEKSPSFSVVPSKGIFHCFGCGAGGDVFKFVEQTRGIPFIDVVKELGQAVGVPIEERELPPEERRRMRARADLFEVCNEAADWFHSNLVARPVGKEARSYLRDRGITDETVARYRLGFAPESWDGLLNHLHQRGITPEQAVRAGLAKARNNGRGAYDAFRDRVIIPIEDTRGRVVAFGGRVMPGGRSDAPKYINSPETPVYKKSSVLYGLRHARTGIQRSGRLLVVEGYFDVISLHQAGFLEAVATCGTALTPEHARTVRPLTRTVIALFDSDAAGERAAARSMEVFLANGIEPKRLTLDGAKDPDEYVQDKGAEAFEAALQRAEPLFELLLRRAMERHGTSPGGRAAVLSELAPIVRQFPPEARDPLVARLGSALWMDPRTIKASLGQRPAAAVRGPQSAPPRWRGSVELNHLLWLLLHHRDAVGPALGAIDPGLVTTRESVIRAMAMLLEGAGLADVESGVDDPDLHRVLRAAAAREDLYSLEQAGPAAEQIVVKLELQQVRNELSALERALSASTDDGKSRLNLLRQRQDLQQRQRRLQVRLRRGDA